MKFLFNLDDNGNVKVFAEPPCRKVGNLFEIGLILEPDNKNPLLQLHKPFGLAGTEELVKSFREWKAGRR